MELKVFSLNCWGIPIISKNRKARIEAIGEALSISDYDIVCLQEVWSDKDFFFIREKAQQALPYSHYFYSGVAGSGVCVLSKHRILDTHFHKWSINGYVHKVQHGDWFGGKGVGLCHFKISNINVKVFTTHLHAEYNRQNDEYYACRVVQAYETAQFINHTSAGTDVVFLVGDLNTEPGDLPYKLMINLPAFKDSFLHKDIKDSTTNLNHNNSYTPSSYIVKEIPGVRIDHIFYKTNSRITARLLNYGQPLPDRVPNCTFSYSDHEAIYATFAITNEESKSPLGEILNKQKETLAESIDVLIDGMKSVKNHAIFYWILTCFLIVLIFGSCFVLLNVQYVMDVVRVFISILAVYTFIMATFWNKIELNSIYAAKLAMELTLNGLEEK